MQMERFVHGQNLLRFSKQLGTEHDGLRRTLLQKLLVEEEDNYGLGGEQLVIVDQCLAHLAEQRNLAAHLVAQNKGNPTTDDLIASLDQLRKMFEQYRKKIVEHFG
jgi:hypothetical protein